MNLVFFDTNAYINLIGKYNQAYKSAGISIKSFSQLVLDKEINAGYFHIPHHLVIMEIIHQYYENPKERKNLLKEISTFYGASKLKRILPPFEIELSIHVGPHERKPKYIQNRLKENDIMRSILETAYASDDLAFPPEINENIKAIANTMKNIKTDVMDFSYDNKHNAKDKSREDLSEEFMLELINCIKLAVQDEMVDGMNLHPLLSAPLACIQSFASNNIYSWSRTRITTKSKVLKNIPNTYIDALILSSACLGQIKQPRTLVSGDNAITDLKEQVNSDTTTILKLDEYLEIIHA